MAPAGPGDPDDDGDQIGLIRNATAASKKNANLATSIVEGTFMIAESLGLNALDNLIFSDEKISMSKVVLLEFL